MRPYQLGTAAALLVVAAVAMFDSRRGALITTDPNVPGGIGAGFYPFWAAALMGGAALVSMIGSWRAGLSGKGVFAGREGAFAVLKLVVPVVATAFAMLWLGFYLAGGLYMGFFARYIGRYGWLAVAASAIATPLAVYLIFEQGFRVPLPKSILYTAGFPL